MTGDTGGTGDTSEPLIVGAGSPLVDLLLEADDALLEQLGSEKGGMIFVDPDVIDRTVRAATTPVSVVPGGSACNTVVGVARLGGRARMIGRLGRDELAEKFRSGLERAGVEGRITESETPTGRVLSVVTPDAQRTMFTYLGAAAEFAPADITAESLADAAIVHLEGYQLYNESLVDRIVSLTRSTGARLALDLAAFQVVESSKRVLERLIPEDVDILLANEDEARAYTGKGEEESLEIFAGLVQVAVVKIGSRGALVARGDERSRVEAFRVDAVDTTAAGDLFASGLLYGLSHEFGLAASARLGCRVASEVVQVLGAAIPDEGWKRLHRYRDSLRGTDAPLESP